MSKHDWSVSDAFPFRSTQPFTHKRAQQHPSGCFIVFIFHIYSFGTFLQSLKFLSASRQKNTTQKIWWNVLICARYLIPIICANLLLAHLILVFKHIVKFKAAFNTHQQQSYFFRSKISILSIYEDIVGVLNSKWIIDYITTFIRRFNNKSNNARFYYSFYVLGKFCTLGKTAHFYHFVNFCNFE